MLCDVVLFRCDGWREELSHEERRERTLYSSYSKTRILNTSPTAIRSHRTAKRVTRDFLCWLRAQSRSTFIWDTSRNTVDIRCDTSHISHDVTSPKAVHNSLSWTIDQARSTTLATPSHQLNGRRTDPSTSSTPLIPSPYCREGKRRKDNDPEKSLWNNGEPCYLPGKRRV